MRKLPLLLCACALALSACASDKPHRKPPEAPWHPATAMLTKYVKNPDGSLTRAQMEAGLRADFDAADKNKTGCLDTDETRTINQERLAEDQSTASRLSGPQLATSHAPKVSRAAMPSMVSCILSWGAWATPGM